MLLTSPVIDADRRGKALSALKMNKAAGRSVPAKNGITLHRTENIYESHRAKFQGPRPRYVSRCAQSGTPVSSLTKTFVCASTTPVVIIVDEKAPYSSQHSLSRFAAFVDGRYRISDSISLKTSVPFADSAATMFGMSRDAANGVCAPMPSSERNDPRVAGNCKHSDEARHIGGDTTAGGEESRFHKFVNSRTAGEKMRAKQSQKDREGQNEEIARQSDANPLSDTAPCGHAKTHSAGADFDRNRDGLYGGLPDARQKGEPGGLANEGHPPNALSGDGK